MLNLLPSLCLGNLETLLNALLVRTQQAELLLRKLSGKVLGLHLQGIDFKLYLLFSEQHIDILHHYEAEPDCVINCQPNILFKITNKANLTDYLNNKTIVLNGDLQLLQDFAALLNALEKDPVELLAPYTGDVLAFSLVKFLRSLATNISDRLKLHQQFNGERLTEEWKLIAPTLAIADFCSQVKTLEKDIVRLEQKIQLLG